MMTSPTIRVTARVLRPIFMAAALLALSPAARAEPIPAPTEPLKDFQGRGVIQLDLPPDPSRSTEMDGKKVLDTGFQLWIPMEQAYIRPDRVLIQCTVLGQPQATLIQGNVERSFSPLTGYIVERQYRGLEQASESPIHAAKISMATYAKVVRELTTGKLVPEQDFEQFKTAATARIAELRDLRMKLMESKDPADIQKAASAAAEMARLRDDLQQIEIRRRHPCHVVEFQNKDLVQNLLSRGLLGDRGSELLVEGKTTVWLTKAHGLPVKIETTASDGRVAISFCFSELKINSGLRAGDVALPAAPGAVTISAMADLSDPKWEEKMEETLKKQIERIQKARDRERAQNRGAAGGRM